MAEIMKLVDHEQTNLLLHNKFVVVLGDSVHRSIYKDLVLLIQKEKYLSTKQLRAKGEISFEGDCLVEGGSLDKMTNGTNYREVRQFRTDHHLVRFYFITSVFSRYMESVLQDFRTGLKPDVIIINSCLWDISRYDPKWSIEYKENLGKLLGKLKEILPEETLVIWNLAMPLGEYIKGGFLVPEVEHKASHLRTDVIEGNFYSLTQANEYGMDVLDLHYHFRHLLQHRTKDGVHWDAVAHRKITSLLILHIAEAWNVEIKYSLVNVGQVQFGDEAPVEQAQEHSGQAQVLGEAPAEHAQERSGYDERCHYTHQPYREQSYQAATRSRRYRHHYTPHNNYRPQADYDERPHYQYQLSQEQSHQARMRSSHGKHHYTQYN